MVIVIVVVVLLIYLVLAWLTASWLHLVGFGLWGLRLALSIVGIAGAGLFLWWYNKFARPGRSQSDRGTDELDAPVREALRRLQSAKTGVDGKQHPVIYVLGASASTKTTTIVNSGLEPELIAGQVYQDNAVVPTKVVNLWYTRQALLVEPGSWALSEPSRWIRLVRKLQSRTLFAAMKKAQAPRAAVVCIDCESLLQPGESLSTLARTLNLRLHEMTRQLGIKLPVYVVFTKLDRLPHFSDYVRNFSPQESSQIFGATLTVRTPGMGVYAEEETKRLTNEFDQLFYSLAEKRLALLTRETDSQYHSGIYEFPREWRKLRSLLVPFLVDLCRPSHLNANPFVRGFYFSGVRAVVTAEFAPAVAATAESPATDDGATRIFSAASMRSSVAQAAPARVAVQKKVPQWVFLTRLFSDVIMKDQTAMGASGASIKVSMMRRVLLAGAALLCLLLAIGFTVSFFSNRALQKQVTAAATALKATSTPQGQLVTSEDLARLDTLRQSIEMLNAHRRDGAPWHMRWGLYAGDSLRANARKVYFAHFHELMFGATQQSMFTHLQNLPAMPDAAGNYGFTYDTLKAYLITTRNSEKSTKEFLAPVLLNRWQAGRDLDPERAALAVKQFEFYATELADSNPYAATAEESAVDRGRSYLGKFAAIERIYGAMLDQANAKYPGIQFNRQFPGSSDVVINNKEIPGAFSKGGFAFMQDAIAHSDRYFAGEEWVLGQQNLGSFDRAAVERELQTRYRTGFVEQWRGFLRSSAVARYGSSADASRKLMLLSGNQSPLLALLWVASTNTAVGDPEMATAFQPVQSVVAPAADRYVGPANQPYMTALATLQVSIDQLAKTPDAQNDPVAMGQVRSAAMSATQSALQVQQGFRVDEAGRVDTLVADLLKAPIRNAEGILRGPEPPTKGLCTQLGPVFNKFPFNPRSKVDASFREVNAIFQPRVGILSQFYEQNLKTLLVRRGSEYVLNPSATVKLSSPFIAFFNRATTFTETVYPNNSQSPNLRFTLRPYPVQGIRPVTFAMNGQTLVSPGGARDFTWSGGEAGDVRVTGKLGGADLGILSYSGPWALFHFFSEADKWQASGSTSTLEWVPKSGQSAQPMIVAGRPLTLRYDLRMAGAPVFNKAFLASLRCTP